MPPTSIGKHIVTVDYKEETELTYLRTAIAIMLIRKDLAILNVPRKAQSPLGSKLLSWVPDWSDTSKQPNPLEIQILDTSEANPDQFATQGTRFAATIGSSFSGLKIEKRVLFLHGYVIDSVERLGRTLEYEDIDFDFSDFKRNVEKISGTIGTPGSSIFTSFLEIMKTCVELGRRGFGLAESIGDIVEEWRLIALDDADNAYATGEEPLTIYKKVLAADTYPHGQEVAEKAFDSWEKKNRILRKHIKAVVENLPDDPQTMAEILPWFRAIYTMNQDPAVSEAMTSQRAALKQHEILKNASFRRMGRTEKGLLGLLPSGCKEGDQIVLLQGGSTPYIARQTKESWIFVGNCYLYGIMDGEAWDESKCREMRFA